MLAHQYCAANSFSTRWGLQSPDDRCFGICSVGTEYDNSHELAVVALILANLSTHFDSQQTISAGSCHTPFVVKILESRAAMEQLFRLAVQHSPAQFPIHSSIVSSICLH